MALISRIPVVEVASVVARALEDLLGHEVVLATGAPSLGEPGTEHLPEGATRTIVLPFSDGYVGELTLVVGERFATAMEAATADASLTTAALPALAAGASAITVATDIGVALAATGEVATETLLTAVVGEFAAVPILEGETCVACVVVRIVDDEPAAFIPTATVPAPAPSGPDLSLIAGDEAAPAPGPAIPPPAPLAPPMPAVAPAMPAVAAAPPSYGLPTTRPEASPGISIHEFQPLSDAGAGHAPLRPLTLLNDVTMEITAELGRGRMRVRDIVGLRPGAVVELDRAAGSPVDVLVNGALVWHGEVVVVDDEFGIRVSEIVTGEF